MPARFPQGEKKRKKSVFEVDYFEKDSIVFPITHKPRVPADSPVGANLNTFDWKEHSK